MFQNIFSSPRRISIGLGVLRFLKMMLGIVVLYLSILYFGTSMQRDAWVIAIGAYGILLQSIYSPVNDTFRTRFIYLRQEKGEADVIQAVNSLVSVFWGSFVILFLLIFLLQKPIVTILAPGFSESALLFLAVLILWLFPYFVFQQMVNITQALLNTYESYFYPDLISLLASIINIIFIILFSNSIGIYSLVIATTINFGLLLIVLCSLLHSKVPSFSLFPHSNFKKSLPFFTFSLPVYLSMFSIQMYALVEKAACSKLGEGSVSLYDYAKQIMNLPYIVFSSIVPIVLTPLLSKYCVEKKNQEYSDDFRKFLRMIFAFTIIISNMMIVNRKDISFLFFNRFDADFELVEIILGIAIIFLIINLMCTQALIAENRIARYVIGITIGNIVSIVACLLLEGNVSLYHIALCNISGQVISASILICFLELKDKEKMLTDIYLLIIIFIGTCCFSLLFHRFINFENGKFGALLNITLSSLVEVSLIGILYFSFFKDERVLLQRLIHHKKTIK